MEAENSTFMDVSPRRILVLKVISLGDIVYSLPVIAALRKRFPSAHVCWLVKLQWGSIFEDNPDADEVLSGNVPWRNWPRLIRDLWQCQCDIVLDFQGLFHTGLLGLLSDATTRLRFACAKYGVPWMHTNRVPLQGEHGLFADF